MEAPEDVALVMRRATARVTLEYSVSLQAMALEGLTMRTDHRKPIDPRTDIKFTAARDRT